MPDPRDLCGLEDVKALMQKSGANGAAQDPLIASLITRASVKIMGDSGREFVPGGATSEPAVNATRTFEYVWSDTDDETYVDLYPYDLQTTVVPMIVADPDLSSPVTLTTDQYRLSPVPPSQGVYMGVRVRDLGSSIGTNWRTRQVQVTGNWGFPSVPFDVNQACAETVIHWITSYPGARRVDQTDAALPAMTPRSYPMSAVDLLRRFWRDAY